MQVSGHATPADTVGYLLRVFQYPSLNTGLMFSLLPSQAPFLPELSVAPPTFAVGLVYPSPLLVSASNYAFLDTYIAGASTSIPATISNAGAFSINIYSVYMQEAYGGADFSVATNCPATLNSGASCTAWVNFTPQVYGSLSSYLAVSSSSGAQYALFSGKSLSNPPTTFSDTLNSTSIFIGASICENWALPAHNAGVGGQVTSQILARFPSVVLGHGYSRVIIMGGTNDVTNGVDLNGVTIPNVQAMGQMAANSGMEVALAAVPPLFLGSSYLSDRVNTLNAGYRQLAVQNGWIYLDFYTPLVGQPQDFSDGEHPNATGYALIDPVVATNIIR
jgi:hypothetical protein